MDRTTDVHRFARYGVVGVGNTLVHVAVFLALHSGLGLRQALSNLLAFAVAVTASYQLNARYTFEVRPTGARYALFLVGMGSLSLLLGALADWAGLAPWLTLVSFSGASLVIGYAYSRAVVFKRSEP